MYTLMRSMPIAPRNAHGRSLAFEQQEVADFEDLTQALAACDKANRERRARHYLMSPAGKEFFEGHWID